LVENRDVIEFNQSKQQLVKVIRVGRVRGRRTKREEGNNK